MRKVYAIGFAALLTGCGAVSPTAPSLALPVVPYTNDGLTPRPPGPTVIPCPPPRGALLCPGPHASDACHFDANGQPVNCPPGITIQL